MDDTGSQLTNKAGQISAYPKVAIIGAGPGGLTAAKTVIQGHSPVSVTVIEKGRKASARICPVDIELPCKGCGGVCNVISGFGGSMHYGDAIKLSRYPAGRRLATLLGNDYRPLECRALDFFDISEDAFTVSDSTIPQLPDLRSYPVAELSEHRLRELLLSHAEVIGRSCTLLKRARVVDVELTCSGSFCLSIERDRRVLQEHFDIVVVASGRAGVSDCSKWAARNAISQRPGRPSIGVRFELPARILAPLYEAHRDFKVSTTIGTHKIKSFCFSAHPATGGRMKYCHYQDQFESPIILLDGHMNSDGPPNPRAKGNFALLAQLPEQEASSAAAQLARRYRQVSDGIPVWQPLTELLGYAIDAASAPQHPSVEHVRRGRISDLIEPELLNDIVRRFMSIVGYIERISDISIESIVRSTAVLAPAFEFFWNEIDVTAQFESSLSNLFFVGDCAGIAQGNLQAAISGIAAGDAINARLGFAARAAS